MEKAQIIDGKKFSAQFREQLKTKATQFESEYGRKVGLAVIIVGDNPASQIYVKNKISACEQIGITSFVYRLEEDVTQQELLEIIQKLNDDKAVDGILVQLPLPKQINEDTVLESINPQKDVDGFHAVNAGALFLGDKNCPTACTAAGCVQLIKSTGVDLNGKNAVIVGRSRIVGKPLAILLLNENCTVTITHSKTVDLASHTKNADILVAAVGKKHTITAQMIKPGAVVIDVGINREDGKIYGDVDFEKALDVAGFITPVPGGVGPMTITMLLDNTIKAALKFAKPLD